MVPEMDRSGDNPATLELAGHVRAMLGEFAMGGGPFRVAHAGISGASAALCKPSYPVTEQSPTHTR